MHCACTSLYSILITCKITFCTCTSTSTINNRFASHASGTFIWIEWNRSPHSHQLHLRNCLVRMRVRSAAYNALGPLARAKANAPNQCQLQSRSTTHAQSNATRTRRLMKSANTAAQPCLPVVGLNAPIKRAIREVPPAHGEWMHRCHPAPR